MAENLTKRFIDHRNISLAAQAVSEFPLNHAERGFDVAPLVVVLQELVFAEVEVVVHLEPHPSAVSAMMFRERNKRGSSKIGNCVCILPARVTLVSRNFGELEIVGGDLAKLRQKRGVVCIFVLYLDSGNNVRLDSAHRVSFDPVVLLPDRAVLVVKPADIAASSKARRIYGKVHLDRFQRQTALDNQRMENWSQFRILKVVGSAVEVRNLCNESARVRFAQVTHKPTLRDGGINFESNGKNRIRERQWWATRFRWNSDQTGGQIGKQLLEFILFLSLRCIVGSPVLRVCNPLGFGHGKTLSDRSASVRVLLSLHYESGCVNVLAIKFSRFVVWAGARGNLRHEMNSVKPTASLRWDNPNTAFLSDRSSCRKFKTALLCRFHSVASLPRRYITTKVYSQGNLIDS